MSFTPNSCTPINIITLPKLYEPILNKNIGVPNLEFYDKLGCCDIEISNEENVIIGRTMEFPVPMNSCIRFYKRGTDFSSVSPNDNGLSWRSIYGFVGISVLDMLNPVDGVNEKGLSCGLLTLDATEYQSSEGLMTIGITDVCCWLLSICSNVHECIDVLQKVNIWGNIVPVVNRVIGLHISLHDKTSNIVVQIINGKLNIYDNISGILTNGPVLPEQFTLLDQYKQGNLAITDNTSSIARFIRLSELKETAIIPETTNDIVTLICHMLHDVDIVKGSCISTQYNNIYYEYTQWVLIKDLINGKIWYRTYDDLSLKVIDLTLINFDKTYDPIFIDNNASIINIIPKLSI
jgi:choloylglycine hydrolase